MSEMKAKHAFDVYEDYTKTGDDEQAQVYLKSEADREIRKQKRKRCLALADYAEAESRYHTTLANGFWLLRNDITKRDEERRIAKRWDKWQNRWLALADKLKEA
jgi:hypothetical protein